MPARDITAPTARKLSRFVLPAFAVISILLAVTWVIWAFTIIPGGFEKATAGTILALVGFVAAYLIQVLAAGVVIVVLESALIDHRTLLVHDIADVLRHLPLEATADKKEHPHD